jgi:hypothetical protein
MALWLLVGLLLGLATATQFGDHTSGTTFFTTMTRTLRMIEAALSDSAG